jgi:hypothetical protein
MYNIKSVGSVSSHKVTNAILGWNGGVALALNYFSATTNVIQGKLMNWMEASARYNNLYTRKNLKTAEKLYWGDIKSNTADWFKTDKKSTTSQLNKKFNVEESYSLENTFVEDNILKKRFNLGTTSQAQESGEHYIQNTLMYAVLDNIKCKNANGDYIDKDGNVVDQESALSLAYAYTLKDGKLELNPHVSSTDKGEIGEELDFTVGRLIRKTMRDLHGNYSKENIALAQRYAAGKLGFFLRKWMVRGYKKRLRGVATSLTSVEDIPEELRYFSKETEEYEEGTYTTAIRFLADVKRRFKEEKFKALSANWADLSDYEKANIMKTVKELSLITGAYIASQVLAGLAKDADDEDDKYWLYMGAFLARRTYSELSFYLNPRETIRIVKSPTATVTLIDDMLDVLDRINPLNYLSEDYNLDDRYERGKRKGKFKIVKELEDVVPILKQFDKTPEDSYNWLLK